MPVRNPRILLIGAALLSAASVSAAPKAPAKGEKPAPTAAKSKLDLAALQKSLESGDEAKTLAALETIAKSGDPAGAPLVEALLGRGADVTVLSRAIETLGILAQPSSGAALAPYAQHRTPELRRAALRAYRTATSGMATRSPHELS